MNKTSALASFHNLSFTKVIKFLFITFFVFSLFSFTNNTEAAVTYQDKGAFASSAAAQTVTIPTGYQNGDVFLLFVESANEVVNTPSGWTQLTNSPQGSGTGGAIGAIRITVFYKIVSGAQSNVSLADAGNHTNAIIMNFRGVDTGAPINVTAGSVGTATTSMVFPTATTTVADAAVILVAAMDTDANSTTAVSNWANANISSLTELHDQVANTGSGGGLAIAAGYKVAAGATGTSTATGSTSVTHAYMTIALKPLVWTVSGTSTNTSASGATVRVAINGTLQAQTTTLNCSGNPCTWSIPNVVAGTNGSIITTWIQNVTDDIESTAVTKYSSGTTISGMILDKNTLTIGSNQNSSISVTELGGCDSDTGCASEDIMHTSNSGALNVMGSTNSYDDATLSILASNTLTADSTSSESVTTDRIVNSGTITSSTSPTYTLTGRSGTLFANSGTFTADKSEVIISSDADVTFNSGSLTLFDLTSVKTGEKSLGAAITFATNGTLEILNGTFNPGTYLATGSGANTLTVASGAVLKVGASAFSGNYSSGFTTINLAGGSTVDYSASGNQTILNRSYYNLNTTGSGTKTLGGTTSVSGVLTIGTGTTLAASSYDITLNQSEGNTPFVNNGTFNAGIGTVSYDVPFGMLVERQAAGSRNWHGITSSSDGAKLAATVSNGYIYTSSDFGVTWTEQTSSGIHNWYDIASSSDGTKLVAGAASDYIYTSTNSGVSWTQQTSSGSTIWNNVSSSSDGMKLAAVPYSGYVSTSSDGGVTWTPQTSSGSHTNWRNVASSSDGTKLATVYMNGYVLTSRDEGVTWDTQTGSPFVNWIYIASSSDGTKLAASVVSGPMYTSIDSGVTWTERTALGIRNWRGITSSADGTKLAIYYADGYILTSSDSGEIWTELTAAGSRNWNSITSSSDGTKLAAVVYGGYIYTSADQNLTIQSGNPTTFYDLSISGSGTRTLGQNLSVSNTLTLSGGTLDTSTSNYSINAGSIALNGGALTSNASIITLTGTGTVFNYTGGTYTPGTSTVKITNSSASAKTFAGGGQTYNNIWFAPGTGTGSLTITGSNTFNNFKDDGTAAHSLLFTTGTTQNIASWTVTGNVGNLITINSTTTGTHTLNYTGAGTVNSDYLNIQHSVATPATTWYAGANSVNNQAVATAGSGWVFGGVTLALEQGSFRFFSNENDARAQNPIASINQSASLTDGDFRLKMLLGATGTSLLKETQNFKLQYALKSGTCDTAFTGESYEDMDRFTAIGFNDNFNVNDGDILSLETSDPGYVNGNVIAQTYIESNKFGIMENVPSNSFGLFDLALRYTGVQSQASYCLRIIKDGGEQLTSYSYIPEIITPIYKSRKGDTTIIESGVTPGTTTTGGETDGGEEIVLPLCSDTIDNDSDILVDTLDPQCHLDGSLGKEYIPTHNSETIAPVTQTGGGQGDNGGDLGFNWQPLNLFNFL